jgi:hypothetical protein
MHLDSDIAWFIYSVILIILVGLPRIRSRHYLPPKLVFAPVPAETLSPVQIDFFTPFDQKLSSIGYFPFSTFTIPNLQGKNLSRAYLSSGEAPYMLVSTLTVQNVRGHSYMEIISAFNDGTKLSTKNSGVAGVFAAMPGYTKQAFPTVLDPLDLKRLHDAKAKTMNQSGEIFVTKDNFFQRWQDYHRSFVEQQVKRHLLSLDQKTGNYRMTYLTALMGIRNFFNPFADNFTWPKFAAGLIFGAALPLLGWLKAGGLIEWLHQSSNLTPGAIHLLLLIALYGLAGVIIGYLFPGKTLIWGFLLGILPPKLLGIVTPYLFGFAAWMAIIADTVSKYRHRRARIV